MSDNVTVVISAAGMGTRLGFNRPKTLIDVAGKSILQRQLTMLSDVAEVVIVAGYRSDAVIDLVTSVRRDIPVVLNHDYRNTGTAASLALGSQLASEWVVSLDGDLLVRPDDFRTIYDSPVPCLGVCRSRTAKPVWATLGEDSSVRMLSQEVESEFEWSGLAKMPRAVALQLGTNHVFQGLNASLPAASVLVDCVEVDDQNDLRIATEWCEQLDGMQSDVE
jgi:choline kinase